jgi:hypothetical protein
MSPENRVYVAPSGVLVFVLGAAVLSFVWNDLTGILLCIAALMSVVGMFVRARRESMRIYVAERRKRAQP